MRRRDFIAMLGATAAWPSRGRAQQPEVVRRVGVLSNISEGDPNAREFMTAFRERLRELGWDDGRNVRIDIRWAGDETRYRRSAEERYLGSAKELVAVSPDVVLAATTPAVTSLKTVAPTLPVVFVSVIDPVGSGLIASMSRPGGYATGFSVFEYGIAAKWLELLKESAPHLTRMLVLRDASSAAGIGQFAAVQTVAPVGLDLSVVGVREMVEVEQAITAFARDQNGGLILTANGFVANHTDQLTGLAARHRLPAISPFRYFTAAGGLMSYGPDLIEPYRRGAEYVGRILRGEKPADLPVQAPTKYELVINLKTAKALDLTIPATLLARANEVVE